MACGALVMEMGAHMKSNRPPSEAPCSISGFTSGPVGCGRARQVLAIYLTEGSTSRGASPVPAPPFVRTSIGVTADETCPVSRQYCSDSVLGGCPAVRRVGGASVLPDGDGCID